jgi:hypothetical protein
MPAGTTDGLGLRFALGNTRVGPHTWDVAGGEQQGNGGYEKTRDHGQGYLRGYRQSSPEIERTRPFEQKKDPETGLF